MLPPRRLAVAIGVLILCASGCGRTEAGAAIEDDEWVVMMAERHPAIADIPELETGTRTSVIRSGGTININYASGVTHTQAFAPTDGHTITAVFDELATLLETSDYRRGADILGRACFDIEYEPGETDQIQLVTSLGDDDTVATITLRISEGLSCR